MQQDLCSLCNLLYLHSSALIGRSAKAQQPTVPVLVESSSMASFGPSEQDDHELVAQADLLESQVSSKSLNI